MAAIPETHPPPPEPPITSLPEIVPATTAQPNGNIIVPPTLAPKRRRRPSVRLGEIGDQHGISRLHNHPPWSWQLSKESSRTFKPRTVANHANEIIDFGNHRRGKAKRGSTKRLRSDSAPKPIDKNGRQDFKNLDDDHDHDRVSPVHSVDENGNGNGYWHANQNNDNRIRVSENEGVESESREGRKNEGVWCWLFDLGLSRYAPMFEIHEVDVELLPMLTLEDLKDMGISAVGSRRKMYTAIQKLQKGFP
ncbi:unnamed protein product [Lathyrus sativus]|nr:unnamed protein product [Lathyrus sativus]